MCRAINITTAAALILASAIAIMLAPIKTPKTESVRSMYPVHFGQRLKPDCPHQIASRPVAELSC